MHAQETEGVPVLLSAKSLTALGAVINFETGQAIFRNLEPETVVQLDRSPTGHLWMDLFEQMPVVSENPLSLLGHVKTRDSRRTVHARQMHSTDNPDAKTVRRSIAHPEKSVTIQSSFNLKRSVTPEFDHGFGENCSHVKRRSDGQTGTVGMGTHCERDVHTSGKEEYTTRTRGEVDEVRDERQHKRMRRSESKEQNRAARRMQGTQYSVVRTRDKTAVDQKDQGGTSRTRTTATSNPGLRTTQRKDVRMGMCSRQTVLRVGSDDKRRGRCDGVTMTKEVCDVRGTVTGNVSENNELTKKKGTQSDYDAGTRGGIGRIDETIGTASSDSSTTEDDSEVQCSLRK